MKLLLFFATFVCALMSPAAVITWGTGMDMNNILSPTDPSSALAGGTAYLVVGDEASATTAIGQLAAGTWTPSVDGSMVAKAIKTGTDSAYISNDDPNGINGQYTSFSDTLVGTQSFYIVLIDNSGEFFMVSSIQSGTLVTVDNIGALDTITWAIDDLDELSNGWQQFGGTIDPGVPEPTALALLALGVAGVALRRRVA